MRPVRLLIIPRPSSAFNTLEVYVHMYVHVYVHNLQTTYLILYTNTMPARIESRSPSAAPAAETTQVLMGGWWPATAIHMQEVEQFLRTGRKDGADTKDSLDRWQKLGIRSVTGVSGILPGIFATTEDDIDVWWAADGVFICSIAQSSVSRARETLRSYIRQTWLPFLAWLLDSDSQRQVNFDDRQIAIVQVTSPHPPLYQVSTGFGNIQRELEQPDMLMLLTSEYRFIITTEENWHEGWTVAAWYIFTASFALAQSTSSNQIKTHKQKLALLTRKPLTLGRMYRWRLQMRTLQNTIADQLSQLHVLHIYPARRVATLTPIFASHDLPQPADWWQAEIEQTHHYLQAEWLALRDSVAQLLEDSLVISQRWHNFNLSLVRFLLAWIAAASVLLWLQPFLFTSSPLSWSGAVLIVSIVALVLHGLSQLLVGSQRYRLRRAEEGKNGKSKTRKHRKAT